MNNIIILSIAYLLGSIPFALIVGKLFYGKDIREFGSGNLGTTNTFRTLGKKAGIIVLLGDIGKGSLAVCLPVLFNSDISPILVGTLAILGHSYPVFANFKGGKSVATSTGVILALSPILFIIGLATFIISLKIYKYVSLSSTITALSIFLSSVFVLDLPMQLFSLCIFVFISFKHKSNFKRIKDGIEPKVKWI